MEIKSFKIFIKESEDKVDNWNSIVAKSPMLKGAVEIVNDIKAAGFEAYIVGGTVRDLILGKEPHDVDISSNMPMEKIEDMFPTYDIGENKTFGVVVVKHNGFDYEITNFREDAGYSDGRRPDAITIAKDFKTDTTRRDFTWNALGVDTEGNIIDFHGGREDLKNKILRTVGDPEQRFAEDFLRMLRAIRFSARLDFNIEEKTLAAIKKHAPNLSKISKERIFQEIYKMAEQVGIRFAAGIRKLEDTGLLEIIFPELRGENLEPVLQTLEKNEIENPVLNLAILLHGLTPEEINRVSSRLKFDNNLLQTLLFVAKEHGALSDLSSLPKLRSLNMMTNKNWNILYHTFMANTKSGRVDAEKSRKGMELIKELNDKFKDHMSLANIKKIVSGDLIMQERGIKAGQEVGKIILKVLEKIVDEEIDVRDLDRVKEVIRSV
jgi:tRNA nucleotidyltransferase/poly(A) polymerase